MSTLKIAVTVFVTDLLNPAGAAEKIEAAINAVMVAHNVTGKTALCEGTARNIAEKSAGIRMPSYPASFGPSEFKNSDDDYAYEDYTDYSMRRGEMGM